MTWWVWLLIGIGIGLVMIGVPVAIWFYGFVKAWDRAWGG